MKYPYELFGIEVGDGWKPIVEPLIKKCLELGGNVDQVKEKFGGLRFYYTPGTSYDDPQWEEFDKEVKAAEEKCDETCEVCGKPGYARGGGWIKTLCDEHANGRLKLEPPSF